MMLHILKKHILIILFYVLLKDPKIHSFQLRNTILVNNYFKARSTKLLNLFEKAKVS